MSYDPSKYKYTVSVSTRGGPTRVIGRAETKESAERLAGEVRKRTTEKVRIEGANPLPTARRIRSFYERWIKQHRNVEQLMGTLLAVEEDSLLRLEESVPHEEDRRALERRVRQSLETYEKVVRTAIKMRNACEQEILSAGPASETPPPRLPRGT